jgi:peptidoglycan lytic transglycosylase
MRPKHMLRKSRPVQLGVGAAMLAIPASALALGAGQADTQSAIPITLSPHRLAFGHDVTVSGTVPAAAAGQTLQLQYLAPARGGWRLIANGHAQPDGRFRFIEPVRQSGLLRVVAGATALAPRGAQQDASSANATAVSTAQRVTVASRFRIRARAINVRGARPVHIRGTLAPGVGGRRVRLLGHHGRGWQTLASARTGPRGGFDLHYSAGLGRHSLRVRFAGDRLNRGSWARAGAVTVLRPSLASWYSDGGATACGFHAQFGVANKSLPCGTKVTFQYGGRSVTAVVDDRGPYVGGREWDLNQNTAGALGFGGVGTVWSSL